ncbi:TMhelix containing protein [Vibrio phage 120E34-1]|nr:TMhelix containing protein [Vibrio phage 120E34-1]
MFSWLGKIFGTDKALESVVSSVSSGLDKLNFSDQEKAEFNKKMSDTVVSWVEASSGQNRTRRFLAIAITFIWLLQYVFSMVASAFIPWVDKSIAEPLKESVTIVGGYADGMTGAMMLIIGFYFAAPHMGQFVNAAMDRFSKTKTG